MAADLKWFKFSPASWMMGRIQRQSESCQASFLRLMCKYWHNQCFLAADEAELECGEDNYNSLVKYKIISVTEGCISIGFLDEQMGDIQEVKKQNSLAGKASAAKRIALKSVEQNPTTVKQASNARSTDKIRVDKIRKEEDKNINNGLVISAADATVVFNSCKKFFIDFYSEKTKTEYYFEGKDAKKLKQLIKKITFKVKEKNSGLAENSDVIRGFEIFIMEAYAKSEHWVKSNFSLTTLDSKFNEIFAQLKNGQSKSTLHQTSQTFTDLEINDELL